MRRKTVEKPVPPAPIARRFALKASFNRFMICPSEALEQSFFSSQSSLVELVTSDGVAHPALFLASYNNENGSYDAELDSVCMARYGMTFDSIRSIWIGRLGYIGSYWHYIELK